MPKSPLQHFSLSPLFLIALFLLLTCERVSVSDLNSMKTVKRGSEMAAEEEMMDSESNRRALLMRRRYISYETLRRDLVPCDRPGASYYNCKGPGVANSYSRGCEIITRCARGD
ncbi:hypothetical protein ACS0TY_023094 [Phlomoides rotata]